MRCVIDGRWLVGVLVVLAGCRTLDMTLGDRFLVVHRESDELRAVTADDARVVVHDFDAPGGDVAFWTKALRRNLEEGRGYVFIDERDMSARGVAGHRMVFETTVDGRAVRYAVALFVKRKKAEESRIRVVEYVAEKAMYEKYAADVEKSISEMQPF